MSGLIAESSVEEVKERADILAVASEFTTLTRQGQEHVGLCPFPDHKEKTGSFLVTPDEGLYHCFGCQKGSDTLQLIMDLKGFEFVEAVEYLADMSGVELRYEVTFKEAWQSDSHVARYSDTSTSDSLLDG